MPKVLKMTVIDVGKLVAASSSLENPTGKEWELGILPEKMSMMQVTPDGKVMIFYVEEESGAQG